MPGGSVLGTAFGWRATFLAVAVLCGSAAIGVLKGIAARPAHAATPPLRPELARLGKPRLIVVMVLAVLVNAERSATSGFSPGHHGRCRA
ncbi:putative MFS family arabinose efflux permease [Lentzea nigeriaca]|nr:MFS transporter [Lentzea nigeriaca]MBM7861498.1 putative MFS family arabinose efflux permease [Lentzea nigeriaca]